MGENKGTIAHGGEATIHDRTGLYIAIFALALSGMGLGYEISQNSSRGDLGRLQEQVIDAKIAAAVSKSEAEANEAKVNSRVAIKEVETLCASLKAAHVRNVDCH